MCVSPYLSMIFRFIILAWISKYYGSGLVLHPCGNILSIGKPMFRSKLQDFVWLCQSEWLHAARWSDHPPKIIWKNLFWGTPYPCVRELKPPQNNFENHGKLFEVLSTPLGWDHTHPKIFWGRGQFLPTDFRWVLLPYMQILSRCFASRWPENKYEDYFFWGETPQTPWGNCNNIL